MALTTNYLVITANTTSGTKTATATPAANDLVVIWTFHTGNTSSAAPTDDQGGTYTLIGSALATTGGTKTVRAWVRDQPATAVSTIFSHAPGTTTGGGILVGRVIGVTKVGINAIRQFANQDDQAGGTTPAPVFGAAARTENAAFGFVMNDTNPATLTQPSGWTESNDSGYATPTTGYYACRISSGETNSTITWGSTSASVFCSAVFEVDASPPMVGSTALSISGSATLAGAGALSGASALALAPTGTLSGSGALIGASALALTPSGALIGAGALVGTSALSFVLSGTMAAPGAMVGTSVLALSPSGTLKGAGSLTGASSLSFTLSGTLSTPAAGAMVGVASLTFSLSGRLGFVVPNLNMATAPAIDGIATVRPNFRNVANVGSNSNTISVAYRPRGGTSWP